MMGSITILPGTGDPNPLPSFGPDSVAGAPTTPPFTLTPVDYDPYALTPSGLIDVTQPFGLNDPARFDASAPDWAPFRSAAPAQGHASGGVPVGGLGTAPNLNFDRAPGSFSGRAPDPVSGFAPRWDSITVTPPPNPVTGVGDTMDQLEGSGLSTAGATGIFGWPLERRGLDDFEQVGGDGLNKAANGMLLGFAPRLGAAVDDPNGQSPTYDAGLASRDAGPAPIGRGLGAVYGVGASPDPNGLAQTLHALARSEAMGGVLGMGLPHAAPLAADLAGLTAAHALTGFGTTTFDHAGIANGGTLGGAYTGRGDDPEADLHYDRPRAYYHSLDHVLQADPIGTRPPPISMPTWGTAEFNPPSTMSKSGFGRSNGDSASFIPIAEKTLEDLEQEKIDEIRRISGLVTPSQPSDYLILFPAPTGLIKGSSNDVPGSAGTISLFRAIGQDEAKNFLSARGYAAGPSRGGKYFAFNLDGPESALNFATHPFNDRLGPMTMTHVNVPKPFISNGTRFFDPGGAGSSIHFDDEFLSQINKFSPRAIGQ